MSVTRVIDIKSGVPYDVYVGRVGKGQDGTFGNPHIVDAPCPMCDGKVHKRGEAVYHFRVYFHDRLAKDPEFKRRVLALRGKVLGCFCYPNSCHGTVIADWVDNQPE